MKTMISITPEDVVAATGLDEFQETAYRCHEVSLAIVRSRLLGPTARVARGTAHGVGGQHSWVVLGDPYDRDATIVDATLWSYVDTVDGIWVGTGWSEHRHVPHGGTGSIWRSGKPSHHGGETVTLSPKTPLSDAARLFLSMVEPLDHRGWAELASSPVSGWPAAEIIAAMDDTPGLRGFVPIDLLGMLTNRNPDGLYR